LALELADEDNAKNKSSSGGPKRVNFGLYFYQGPSTLSSQSTDDSRK
jgi:hypothetical protein